MSRAITTIVGATDIPLPNGWSISSGDTVVVSDEIWQQILTDDRLAANVVDLGSTTDAETDPPTWRDMQRNVGGVDTNLVGVAVIAADKDFPPRSTPLGTVTFRRRA